MPFDRTKSATAGPDRNLAPLFLLFTLHALLASFPHGTSPATASSATARERRPPALASTTAPRAPFHFFSPSPLASTARFSRCSRRASDGVDSHSGALRRPFLFCCFPLLSSLYFLLQRGRSPSSDLSPRPGPEATGELGLAAGDGDLKRPRRARDPLFSSPL